MGGLGLFTRSAVRPPQPSLEVVAQLSGQIALAIENALLYQQSQHNAVELEQRVRERTAQLENALHELESFSYSISHDLRSPLRSISGFSQLLEEEYQYQLDENAQNYLKRISLSSQRMAQLIDDLLNLSRLSRAALNCRRLNLSELAQAVVDELRSTGPERQADVQIQPGMSIYADPNLLRVVMVNLLGNAWKFTARAEHAVISVGSLEENGKEVFFVRDNGAGFDQRYVNKLFGPFQRLHTAEEFEGTGIGLATVQRIIRRHGGSVWAEGELGKGAVFYFSLPVPPVTKPLSA
jgi:light-regulated signal transduction histidine kinase (bacteriophytochrome)